MRRLYLRDCKSGDVVEDVYVLSNKQLAATNQGKPYIKAMVGDCTMQVTARMWNAGQEIFADLPESGFCRIKGRIENYQSNLQFVIDQIWPAEDGTFDIADLLPATEKDVEQMFAQLQALLLSVSDRHLLALVRTYFDDAELMRNFKRAPAAQTFHHAFIGGLLEHTLNAVEVGDAICKFYPLLNRDLVIAGIFLHDIAKTWELCYDCAFSYTDGGQLVGHVVKSAMWIEHKAEQAAVELGEPIPPVLIDVLQHIVLSHHGLPEYGAARVPSTPEAIAVHMIENLDAKLMMSLDACRGPASRRGGNWTEYMKAIGGRLYRPDVAPRRADVPAPSPAPVMKSADDEGVAVKIALNNPLFAVEPAKQR